MKPPTPCKCGSVGPCGYPGCFAPQIIDLALHGSVVKTAGKIVDQSLPVTPGFLFGELQRALERGQLTITRAHVIPVAPGPYSKPKWRFYIEGDWS